GALRQEPRRVAGLGVGRLGALGDDALEVGERREGLRRLAAQRPVEAGLLARVAGDPDLVDEQDEGVPVAVEADRPHALGVAARRALVPELVAGAAPEPGLPLGQRALERRRAHP